MTFTTPHGSVRYRLPWSWTAFDYRTLCRELWAQCGAARFETAKVEGRTGDDRAHRPRRPARPADRRRPRLAPRARRARLPAARGAALARPGGPPAARARPARQRRAGRVGRPLARPPRLRAGACRPPARSASASAPTTRATTSSSRRSSSPSASRPTPSATRATGSRTACASATDGEVFYAGDSAGHCFALSGEGIRTALYFGIAAGRELQGVLAGERTRARGAGALRGVPRRPRARPSAAPCASSGCIPALPPRALTRAAAGHALAARRRPRLRLVPGPGARRVRAPGLNLARPSADGPWVKASAELVTATA